MRPILPELFVKLIDPESRDDTCKKMRRVFSESLIQELKNAINDTEYSYRAIGPTSARAKVVLDDFVIRHQFNPLNPNRLIHQINLHRKFRSDLFVYENLMNKDVLEYGCGQNNPWSSSLLLYINGAKSVVAYEPFPIHKDLALCSLKEFIFAVLRAPSNFNFSGISKVEMVNRLLSVDYESLINGNINLRDEKFSFLNQPLKKHQSMFKNKFTLVLSTSVFEHVDDISSEMRMLYDICTSDVVMLHHIDFTDHRMGLPDYHPFKFMQDGILGEINGLRFSDIVNEFKDADFDVSVLQKSNADVEQIFLTSIRPEYRHYGENDLTVNYARLQIKKPAPH